MKSELNEPILVRENVLEANESVDFAHETLFHQKVSEPHLITLRAASELPT